MFTFERVGYEPEMFMEDYGLYYADTMDPFVINDYYNDEGYDMAIIPVVSINRKDCIVELYEFAYDDALPSDKPKIIKAIMQLVELKDELNINNYRVIGEGLKLYHKLYNRERILWLNIMY